MTKEEHTCPLRFLVRGLSPDHRPSSVTGKLVATKGAPKMTPFLSRRLAFSRAKSELMLTIQDCSARGMSWWTQVAHFGRVQKMEMNAALL